MEDRGRTVLISANPMSGARSSRQRVSDLREALLAAGYACEIRHSLDGLRRDALAASHQGQLRAIVSAGGDGTADALANLLPPDIPLLLFPMGTENLLAKHFGITGD